MRVRENEMLSVEEKWQKTNRFKETNVGDVFCIQVFGDSRWQNSKQEMERFPQAEKKVNI